MRINCGWTRISTSSTRMRELTGQSELQFTLSGFDVRSHGLVQMEDLSSRRNMLQ
jgi:hypothetical protein